MTNPTATEVKLTDNQRDNLNLIADGYGSWRRGFISLERRGLISRYTYANGDHAELTNLGRRALSGDNP